MLDTIYDLIKTLYPDKKIFEVNVPPEIEEYIFIKDIQGRLSDKTLTGERIKKPSLQVQCVYESYIECKQIMDAIHEMLINYSDDNILNISEEMEPLSVGENEKEKNVIYCRYKLQIK